MFNAINSKKGVTLYRADGSTYAMGETGADIQLETRQKKNLTALVAEASLVPSTPLFKRQIGLDSKRALEVNLPLENTRMLAIYQHKDWWLRAQIVSDCTQVPSQTQLLLWQRDDGYHVLIALCGDVYRSDITSCENGVSLCVSSNQEGKMSLSTPMAIYGVGQDPYRLCDEAVCFGAQMTGAVLPRKEKVYPEVFDTLGWCTWDAFYQEVHAKGIVDKMEELKQKQLPIGWVLIDDGWSVANYKEQRLMGLGADKEKFPDGLSGLSEQLKKDYGVKHMGVWQALMGYWNGIEEGSKAHSDCVQTLLTLPDGRVVPHPENAFSFWNKWHNTLKQQGVSFVKIDEQSAPSLFFEKAQSYGEASLKMQDGIGASVGLNFSGNAIHCMGMAPQEMWHRKSQALIRSSDDYVPTDEDGFGEHLRQNVYGAMLYAPLYWGDWDMFWTREKNSERHAMLRALSGGPVYISDKVGQTDPSILWPLITADGKLIRGDQVGRPTLDCLLKANEEGPVKVFTTWQDTYLVGVFANEAAKTAVKLAHLPDTATTPYILYEHQGESVVLMPDGAYELDLEKEMARMILLVPKRQGVTALGLVDKYLSSALVASIEMLPNRCVITLEQGGLFAFHSDDTPQNVLLMGKEVPFDKRENGIYTVDCFQVPKPIIEIIFG